MGLNVSKRRSYEQLIEIVIKNNQEKELSKILQEAESFDDVIKHYSIAKAIDSFSKEELLLIADLLS